MGNAGESNSLRQDCKTGALRKAAERQRLAEALRANLSRRKVQSRDRRAGEAAGKESVRTELVQTGSGPSDAAAKRD